ncbi:MAG: TonB-dependent receptor, partial [Caulobacter sp.]
MLWLLCALAASADVPPKVEPLQPALADEAPTALDGVEVTARRGAAAMPPEYELGPDQIDAMAADDISQVVNEVNRRFGGGSGPVVIVNGQQVSDADAFMGFPPDALVRVEVLPPSAAATYGAGGDPSRRVVNIVLQKSFSARDGMFTGAAPTAGGTTSLSGDLRRSRIIDMNTTRVGVRVSGDTSLRADERPDYLADHPDSAEATLRPESRRVGVDLSGTGGLGKWRGSLRAMLQAQNSSFTSDTTGGDPVVNRSEGRNANVMAGLGGQAAGWQVRSTLSGSLSRTRSSGLNDARTDNRSASLSLAGNRTLLTLPAGPLNIDLSSRTSRSHSQSRGRDIDRSVSTASQDLDGSLSLPLLSAMLAEDWPGPNLGDLTLRLQAGSRRAGASRGENLGANLFWTPIKKLNLSGAWLRATDVPTDEQRLAPLLYGNPTVVFDFRTGQSVEVLPITGGNPDLRAAKRDSLMIGASGGPYTRWNLNGGINYQRSESIDGIGSLPQPTADLEAAFPDRFQRDAEGRLVSIDQRPINIASSTSTSLTTNLNLSIPLGDQKLPSSVGTMQVSLNHTVRLSDQTVIRVGLPRMDRLAGDGGGVARHDIGFSVSGRRGPWSVNAGANWRSAYRIRDESGRDGDGDLKISAFGTLDAKISYLVNRKAAPPPPGASSPAAA